MTPPTKPMVWAPDNLTALSNRAALVRAMIVIQDRAGKLVKFQAAVMQHADLCVGNVAHTPPKKKSDLSCGSNRLGILFCWSEREDLNLRPLEPHSSALPDCATLRRKAPWISSWQHCVKRLSCNSIILIEFFECGLNQADPKQHAVQFSGRRRAAAAIYGSRFYRKYGRYGHCR